MINLVQKDEKEELLVKRIRSMVWPITTLVLAGYLLLASGMLGWWWWWSSRQKVTSTEVESLRSQLLALEKKNLLATRLNDRVKFVDSYLVNRKPLDRDLEFVRDDEVEIRKWILNSSGIIGMDVIASTSGQLDRYTKRLSEGYGSVFIEKVLWVTSDGYWKANILLDKGKL
jgi:hypothetical protein